MRTAKVNRKTAETDIKIELNLDGTGKSSIDTGVGFFDHMLTLLSKHGFFDLTVKAKGDLATGCHHTVEDCGLSLGEALKKAIGTKEGINRYGEATIPMDEALFQVVIDFSGRPFLSWQADIRPTLIGNMETEMAEEFFRAVAMASGMTLHVREISGNNTHHKIECIFKAFARSLSQSVALNPKVKGVMSSKGKL